MEKYWFFFKRLIILFIIFVSLVVLSHFYYFNQKYLETSQQYGMSWTVTIIYFIFFFYVLFFVIDLNIYNKIFFIIIFTGTLLWIFIYFLELLKIESIFSLNLGIIQDAAAIISFSIVSPGLILNFFKYIKNNSNQDKKRKIIRNYHIHEGFVGLLFIIIAIFFLILRQIMIQYEILQYQLRIFLALDMILLFFFLFSGSFLIFRDRRDVFKLKFIEKRGDIISDNSSSVFNPITIESIEFFKFPRLLLYPFGILLSSLAVNLFIHGTDFLPKVLFKTNHEKLVLIGIVFSLIGGGIIGVDWYRIFARLYPHLYQELEHILKNLAN